MTDIFTVPGVTTVHARSTWVDPAYPITGPHCDWSQVTTPVAHYTADDNLIDGDPGEHADGLPAYIRAMQQSYVTHRGYSVGYWWAVDWLGGAWQLRGWEFRSAANVGDVRKTGVKQFNPFSAPVLFLVDGADPATPEAIHTARMIWAEAARRAGMPSLGRPLPHSALDYTSCCGDGIRDQIDAGMFDPPVISPIDPPSPQEDIMFVARNAATGAYHLANGIWRRWEPDQAKLQSFVDACQRAGRPTVDLGSGKPVTNMSQVTDVDASAIEATGRDVGA